MTRAHRQRHRRLWLALALLLPALFVAGQLARRPVPIQPAAPDPLVIPFAPLTPR